MVGREVNNPSKDKTWSGMRLSFNLLGDACQVRGYIGSHGTNVGQS